MAAPSHTVLVGFNVPGKRKADPERRYEPGDAVAVRELTNAQVHELVEAGALTALGDDAPADDDAEGDA